MEKDAKGCEANSKVMNYQSPSKPVLTPPRERERQRERNPKGVGVLNQSPSTCRRNPRRRTARGLPDSSAAAGSP